MKLRNIIKSFIISSVLIIIIVILSLFLLYNLKYLIKFSITNELIDIFFNKLSKCKRELPYLLILFIFLFDFFINYLLLGKKKVLCIVINIVIVIVGIISICLLTTYDGVFLFQIYENIKESLREYA